MTQTAAYIVTVYAVLVGCSGFVGYLKAKSLPSLVMGSLSFLALLAAAYGMGVGKAWRLPLALVKPGDCRWRCFSWSFSVSATPKAVPARSCRAA